MRESVRRPCEGLPSGRPRRRRPAGQSDVGLDPLEAVLESVEEGLVICDTTGNVLRMDRRALDIHQYASVGQAWRSLPESENTFALYDPEGNPISQADGPLRWAVRGEMFREWEVRTPNKRTGREWELT
jgi:hypothetical protein